MLTLFEYRYRDAGNFKAFGRLALYGALTQDEMRAVRSRLSGDGLFIAEQLNVPSLYEQLYQWSDGPTAADHCWHEFVDIHLVDETEGADACSGGEAKDFVARLLAVDTWQESLSPHFLQQMK